MMENKATKLWYLFPVFLGPIGGMIMFIILRKEDEHAAKMGLVTGFIMILFWLSFYLIVFGAWIDYMQNLNK